MKKEIQLHTIKRLTSSVNGNPRFEIIYSDANDDFETATTMSDAGFCYAIGNPGLRSGDSVVAEFTASGRIRNMETK